MPPNTERHESTLNFKKYPTNRDITWKTGDSWLDGKKCDDGAEGLWRIHDNIYDLKDFVHKHPGGSMWLEITQGTDISEAFESHHITKGPEELLKKFFVRKARAPRNSPFTFAEDGFYRTLKRNAGPLLKGIPKETSMLSDFMIDALLVGTFAFSILAATSWSYLFGVIAGLFLAVTTIAAHNYFHKKDNFRMYYFNFSLMQFREWRITHALSHHLFPNTIIDCEISFIEPLIEYFPKKKAPLVKYGCYAYILLIWANTFLLSYVKRIVQYLYLNDTRPMHWSEIVPFMLPSAMYIFGSQTVFNTIWMWLFIVTIGSLWFSIVGYNAAHHHPEIFHDGDVPRAKEMDWGIYQLDAVADRYDITGNPFLVLTNFGDHCLHHLFPTLDHTALDHLYPVLNETMKEFGVELQMFSQLELVKGHLMQVSRETPKCSVRFKRN